MRELKHLRLLIVAMAMVMVGFGTILVWAYPVSAQSKVVRRDFRGQQYSIHEFERALFPRQKANLLPRGIPQMQPPPPPTDVKPSVVLNVFFAFDSDKILPRYYPDLDILGEVLSMPPHVGARIEIEGHTDSIGQERYNQTLSLRRAESIVRYLAQHFPIDPQLLLVKGHGEGQPIADNATPSGRRVNRRVEVMNIGQ